MEVNLKMLLEQSLMMVKEKAMKHEIHLSTNIGEIPEIILVDERKFKQILYNLLSNAVKFVPDSGRIELSARIVDCMVRSGYRWGDPKDVQIVMDRVNGNDVADAQHKKCIEFSVSDTGIGIKPEDQKRIFNPFEQVDSSIARKYQGTGLGLSLAKRLIELHGGKIWVESEGEGKGSTFRCIMPIHSMSE
jgi:signal transduction histidine kinase